MSAEENKPEIIDPRIPLTSSIIDILDEIGRLLRPVFIGYSNWRIQSWRKDSIYISVELEGKLNRLTTNLEALQTHFNLSSPPPPALDEQIAWISTPAVPDRKKHCILYNDIELPLEKTLSFHESMDIIDRLKLHGINTTNVRKLWSVITDQYGLQKEEQRKIANFIRAYKKNCWFGTGYSFRLFGQCALSSRSDFGRKVLNTPATLSWGEIEGYVNQQIENDNHDAASIRAFRGMGLLTEAHEKRMREVSRQHAWVTLDAFFNNRTPSR